MSRTKRNSTSATTTTNNKKERTTMKKNPLQHFVFSSHAFVLHAPSLPLPLNVVVVVVMNDPHTFTDDNTNTTHE